MVLRLQSKVAQVLKRIRPTLESNGSVIRLLGVDEGRGVVRVILQGECVRTSQARETLRNGLEEALKRQIPEVREVLEKAS